MKADDMSEHDIDRFDSIYSISKYMAQRNCSWNLHFEHMQHIWGTQKKQFHESYVVTSLLIQFKLWSSDFEENEQKKVGAHDCFASLLWHERQSLINGAIAGMGEKEEKEEEKEESFDQ